MTEKIFTFFSLLLGVFLISLVFASQVSAACTWNYPGYCSGDCSTSTHCGCSGEGPSGCGCNSGAPYCSCSSGCSCSSPSCSGGSGCYSKTCNNCPCGCSSPSCSGGSGCYSCCIPDGQCMGSGTCCSGHSYNDPSCGSAPYQKCGTQPTPTPPPCIPDGQCLQAGSNCCGAGSYDNTCGSYIRCVGGGQTPYCNPNLNCPCDCTPSLDGGSCNGICCSPAKSNECSGKGSDCIPNANGGSCASYCSTTGDIAASCSSGGYCQSSTGMTGCCSACSPKNDCYPDLSGGHCGATACNGNLCSLPSSQTLIGCDNICDGSNGCGINEQRCDIQCTDAAGHKDICNHGACTYMIGCTNSCLAPEAGNNLCGGCAQTSPDFRCCSSCRRMTAKTYCSNVTPPGYEPICSDTDPTCGGTCTGGPTLPPGSTPFPSPSPTPTPTPLPPGAWWQVKDGDVAAKGDLQSRIPTGLFFDTKGAGGFPGIPAYLGSTNLTGTTVSETGWLTNSDYSSTKIYDSSYFLNAIPEDTVITQITQSSIDGSFLESGGEASYGYLWYEYDGTSSGDLTINSAADLGDREVVLIVKNANLNINGNINFTKGSGFFLAVAGKKDDGSKGDITVDPGVTNLEGIYAADDKFQTGSVGTGDSQLVIRGSVAAYGGIEFQRDLGDPDNQTTPAEIFEYAPDLELLFPEKLLTRTINWKEVAP
jgi:hypothetical protein